jgi:hypothetical protein
MTTATTELVIANLDEQTQSDLGLLLDEQDIGWWVFPSYKGQPVVKTGIGGCLMEQMDRLLDRQGITKLREPDERRQRKLNMIGALGFKYPLAMMAWNDQQRDPDVIKLRIKEALNA